MKAVSKEIQELKAKVAEIEKRVKVLHEGVWTLQRTMEIVLHTIGLEVRPIFRPQTPTPGGWSEYSDENPDSQILGKITWGEYSDETPDSQILRNIAWGEEEEEEEAAASE